MIIYLYLLTVIGVITFLVQVQLRKHSHYKVPETVSETIDTIQSLNPAVGIA